MLRSWGGVPAVINGGRAGARTYRSSLSAWSAMEAIAARHPATETSTSRQHSTSLSIACSGPGRTGASRLRAVNRPDPADRCESCCPDSTPSTPHHTTPHHTTPHHTTPHHTTPCEHHTVCSCQVIVGRAERPRCQTQAWRQQRYGLAVDQGIPTCRARPKRQPWCTTSGSNDHVPFEQGFVLTRNGYNFNQGELRSMSAAAAAAADSPGSLGERLQKVLFLRLHTVKLASQVSRDLTAAARKGGRERCALALAIAIDVAAGAMLVTLAAQAAMDMAPRSLHDTAAGAITTLCGTMVTELQGLLESLMEAPVGGVWKIQHRTPIPHSCLPQTPNPTPIPHPHLPQNPMRFP